MAKVFYGCCSVYPTYGKDNQSLVDALQMFNMCLFDYTGQEIKDAFIAWMRSNKQFPTPSDIISLIERKGKPAFDKTVYLNLSKKAPQDRTDDEWQYMREYEKWQVSGEY